MTWTADLVAISYAAYRHRKARPVLRKVGCRAWTPDLLQGLRVLAALGYSSRDIACVLGMDRKAGQSKAWREGIKISKKKPREDGSPSEAHK